MCMWIDVKSAKATWSKSEKAVPSCEAVLLNLSIG